MPVVIEKPGRDGRIVKDIDMQGNVFAPVPGQPLSPCYDVGPPGKSVKMQDKDLMYQCPVSAIPPEVWDLFSLYNECRLLNALPYAGAVMDQPMMIRRAFPIFAHEQAKVRQMQQAAGGEHAALAMAAQMMAAMGRR